MDQKETKQKGGTMKLNKAHHKHDRDSFYEALIKKAPEAIQKRYIIAKELRDISEIVKRRQLTKERKLKEYI